MEICHLFRNFSNGANYARDLFHSDRIKDPALLNEDLRVR